ncbi:MAG: Bbp16 family capsid cement protein [Pseudomonadota bacterium]
MAILSLEMLFSDQQAITADALSTNIFDRQSPGSWIHSGGNQIIDDLGNSMVPLFFQVTEAFNNLTSLGVQFIQSANSDMSSPSTIYSETIALADLTAGRKFAVRYVPHDVTDQYLSFNYDVTGTAPTTGKVTAGFACQEDSWGTR